MRDRIACVLFVSMVALIFVIAGRFGTPVLVAVYITFVVVMEGLKRWLPDGQSSRGSDGGSYGSVSDGDSDGGWDFGGDWGD